MYLFNRNKGVLQPLHLTERGKHLFLLSYLSVVILKAHPFMAERVEAAERDVVDSGTNEPLSASSLESSNLTFVSEDEVSSNDASLQATITPQQVFEPLTTLSEEELLEQPALYTSAMAASSASVPTVTTPVSDLMTTNFEVKDDTIYWKHEFNPGFVDREEMTWFFNVPASVSSPTNWQILRYDDQGQLLEQRTDWSGKTASSAISYETIDFISAHSLDHTSLKVLQMIEAVDFEGYNQVLTSSQPLHYLLRTKNQQAGPNRWVVTYQTQLLDKEKTPDYVVGLYSTDSQEPYQLQRVLVDYGKILYPDLKKPEQPKVWPVYAGDHSISGRTDPYLLVTVSMVNDATGETWKAGRHGVTPTITNGKNGINGVSGTYTAKSDSAGHFRVGIPEAKANDQFTVDVASVLGIRSDLLTLTVGVPTGTTPAIQTTSDTPGYQVKPLQPSVNPSTPVLIPSTVTPQLVPSSPMPPQVSQSLLETNVHEEVPVLEQSVVMMEVPKSVTASALIQRAKTLLRQFVQVFPPALVEPAVESLQLDDKGRITIVPVAKARHMRLTYQTRSGQKKTVTIQQNDKALWESSDDRLTVDTKTGTITLEASDFTAGSTLSVEMRDKGHHVLETRTLEIPSVPSTPKMLPYKGDILVLPPTDAVELLLSYKDSNGYMHVIEVYKNSQTNNWESTSEEIFLSSGLSLIIIPNRSVTVDTEVVVTTRNAAGFYSEDVSERTADILAKSELETEKLLENYLKDNP